MKIQVEEYIREDGSSPYQVWFEGLDVQAAAKVAVAKVRLQLGNTSNVEWFRGIGECKIDWGPGYRIYLMQDGATLLILLGGSSKKNQQKAIEQALVLRAEYKARKQSNSQPGKRSKPHDLDS